MRARLDLILHILLGASLAACHGRPAPVATAVPTSPDRCAVLPDSGSLPKHFVVAFTDSATPDPLPGSGNRTTQIVSRFLYDPLIRLTCDDAVVPALAESWATEDGGRSWTFTLRTSARFWDGYGVRPADIVAAWTRYQSGDLLVPWAGIRFAREVGERSLAVYSDSLWTTVPPVLADPRLAVTRPTRSGWPMGTGPYRPIVEEEDSLELEWWNPAIRGRQGLPGSVLFLWANRTGARDLLDAGVDMMITDDASVQQYAEARSGYTVATLPWDRTYVLFVPSSGNAGPPSQTPPAGFLGGLAREAVSVEARAAEPKNGWQLEACTSVPGFQADPSRQLRRVVYPSDDQTARELAQRLVTFAGTPVQGGEWLSDAFRAAGNARTFPFAAGLDRAAWRRALARGDETAYVFAVPSRSVARCVLPQPAVGAWVPLIETRARLIARPGAGGGAMYLDWNGTPHLRDPR
ncbi:MAG: hypothetical protein HY700_04265 [Gemmatimonadetes bacterium]|nr:hypothetical protein [Gemmatimonadota bacterium]